MADPFTSADLVNAVIKLRRDTDAVRQTIVIADGELIYTTDTKRTYIGDGVTVGGNIVGNKTWFTNNLTTTNISKYDLVYRTDLNKFYALTGDNKNSLANYIPLENNVSTGINYTLTPATIYELGGIIVKDGLAVDGSGNLSVGIDNSTIKMTNNQLYVDTTQVLARLSIPYGSSSTAGLVKPLNGLLGNSESGDLSVNFDNNTIRLSGAVLIVDQMALSSLKISDGTSVISVSSLTLTDGLSVDETGITRLEIATPSNLGGLILGSGLSGNSIGTVELYAANITQLGGIRTGQGLSSVNTNGTVDILVDNSTISFDVSGNISALYNAQSIGAPKAWVNFSGYGPTGNMPLSVIRNSYNVVSTYKHSTGVYSIFYSFSANAAAYNVTTNCRISATNNLIGVNPMSLSSNGCTIGVVMHGGSPSPIDNDMIFVTVYSY